MLLNTLITLAIMTCNYNITFIFWNVIDYSQLLWQMQSNTVQLL